MRTLSRYFVARYLGLFAVILVGTALAIASVELLLGSDELVGTGSGAEPLRWVLWRIPSYYLADLVPISAFFAAFFTIGLAVRWLEWTALQAGGVPPVRVVLPVIGAAIFLALGMGLVRETWVTRAIRQHAAAQRGADEDLLFRAGSFWYQKGRSIFSIGSADATTGTLRGVEVFQRTPHGRLRANIRAARVTVRPDGSWILHDAEVRRFDPEHPAARVEIHTEPALELDVSESSALLMEQTDAAALPLPQLVEYIRAHADDDHPGSRSALRRLELAVHRRLSEPAWVVVLSVLALPLALRVSPGGSLAPAGVAAIGAIGAFFLTRNLLVGLASREIVPAATAIWSLPLGFTAIAVAALVLATRSARP